MGCGGEGESKSCSGHGRCLSMRELALLHEDNGGLAPLTYGSDPNAAITWDADRIFGCHCDEGYEGYDCSLRSCALGIDPLSGSSDLLSCSNPGICGHDTGKCQCFVGWGRSDGSGHAGSNNDCGHRLALRGYP